LGLLEDNSGMMNDLHMLLSTIKTQLKAQQYSNKPTLGEPSLTLNCSLASHHLLLLTVHHIHHYHCVGFLKASQAGFDWFVATVFLITRGSLQTTLNTLQEMSCLLTSAYVWPSRLHKSVRQHKVTIFSY